MPEVRMLFINGFIDQGYKALVFLYSKVATLQLEKEVIIVACKGKGGKKGKRR